MLVRVPLPSFGQKAKQKLIKCLKSTCLDTFVFYWFLRMPKYLDCNGTQCCMYIYCSICNMYVLCQKYSILNIRVKTKSVTTGADATVYVYLAYITAFWG